MSEKFILLVEDNSADVELTKQAFTKNNIMNKIVVASDGEKALDYLFNENNPKPTVVLLDLKMPKIDGLEVLKRIRADTKTKLLPVVILTSSREEKDLVSGYALGANSYIIKSMDFEKFIDAIRQLGLYWLLLNEPLPAHV